MEKLIDRRELHTPCYIVDEKKLRKNGEILKGVAQRTGAKILLAQKAFSMYETYPLLKEYLDGTTASGLCEARLGREYFEKETHVFSAAYRADEMEELLEYADHIVFNSFAQFYRYRDVALEKGKTLGIRINPQCSTQEGHEIYDPCGVGSRLGVTLSEFEKNKQDLSGLSGLHFHTLCEQDSDALETTLHAVEEKFGGFLANLKWLNFGGGHHITREGYDISRLERCIRRIQEKYQVVVYLEPGEAVALNAGYLASEVLDIVYNDMEIGILDTSAACHMPDVLEMPYQPRITGAVTKEQKEQQPREYEKYRYPVRLAGPTCLAGDIIGDYYFEEPLTVGRKLIFHDMAIYSMVKNNTFNGMVLPDIDFLREDGTLEIVKSFGYEDFKRRL